MAKKPNEQIGTCPCPFKGCEEAMAVKKFAARTDDTLQARKAGKLYADCPVHGRFGFDGSKATQEYLLDKGDFWNPVETEKQQEAAAAAELERKRAAIQRRPSTPAPGKIPPASSTPTPAKKPNELW